MDTTKKDHTLRGFIIATIAAAMVFGLAAHNANAQVPYTTSYVPRTQDETIAYLHGVIAGMLAQLGGVPSGVVLGETYTPPRTDVRYDIDVGTSFLRSSDDELQLNGVINLDGAPYADVWFEYGTDEDDLDERTQMQRIRSGTRFSIEIDKDEFEPDEWYSYRAVAEGPSGERDRGNIRTLFVSGVELEDFDDDDDDRDDEPDVETGRAENIDENSAELTGEVDMNDFDDGIVFFVYGEDEEQIEDVDRDYDSYNDVDEDGDDLQKELVDSSFDGSDDFTERVTGLDEDTEYFFQLCVEYEDEDDDETLECGGVEDFVTDED